MEADVETKIKYYDVVEMTVHNETFKGSPFVRQDFHEDGSKSVYFGIEIESNQLEKIAGTDGTS